MQQITNTKSRNDTALLYNYVTYVKQNMVSQDRHHHQVVRNFNRRVQPTPVPSNLPLACVPLEFLLISMCLFTCYTVEVKQLPIAQNIYNNNGGD